MSRTMEGSPGASAPVLSAALLARIHELNLDYVELLISEHASQGCAAQLQHLPPRLLPTIALSGRRLSPRAGGDPVHALFAWIRG